MKKISKEEVNKANTLVNKYLCNFISDKFLRVFKDSEGMEISQNQYSKSCGLSSSTLTKIKDENGYDLPMSTIYNICRHEQYSLNTLFKEFEKKYGVNIQE